MIDLNKIPNIILYDMFRSGKEVNFCRFLDDLERKLREKEERFQETLEKMDEKD